MARSLTILAIGTVAPQSLDPLLEFFPSLEILEVPIATDAELGAHGPQLNRAIDGSAHPWILLLREREQVSKALASEIAATAIDAPVAWAARIRTDVLYRGQPLGLATRQQAGEIRLVHRRHCRFPPGQSEREMRVEGPVKRFRSAFLAVSFRSAEEHYAALERTGRRCDPRRRAARFMVALLRNFPRSLTRGAAGYLWVESAFEPKEAS